nr:14290_t:CDS:2 [Entrophospora candida]
MEIYENKDFNSDDDNATVRGDESEAEHTDFPTFSNDDGIKHMGSNSFDNVVNRRPPSKRQLISKSNIDNNDNDVKQKKMKSDNKDKVTKTKRLTRSPNKQLAINKSLRLQSTHNISNSNNRRKFIYKVNEIDKNDIFARDRAGQTNLNRACQEGKLDRVKYLIDKGSDINACDNAGWTSLHEAAYHGYLDIVYFLLENGSEVNAISYNELDTPLHDACAEGHEDIIRALLEYGADPEKTNVHEKKPGDYTNNSKIIKLLGTPVEAVKTPVKKSNLVYSNKRPSNTLLLKSSGTIGGDDVQIKRPIILETNDISKPKPKGFANKKNLVNIPESQKSIQKKSPIPNSNSVTRNNIVINNYGIIKKNKSRNVSSKFSNNDILRMDLKSRDLSGRGQLHIHAKKGNMEMIGNLIEAGAKVNITDNNGRTPLHESAYEGHYEIVNILVAMGANINATDRKFNTPLHDAVKNGHTDVVEVLLLNNAKPCEKNIENRMPLDLAKCRKDIVELLCKVLQLNPEDYLHPIISNNNNEIVEEIKIEPHEEIFELEVKEVLIDNSQTSLNFNAFEELPHTPEYLKMEIKDKHSGPLYTVQLNTGISGYPLAAPTTPASGTLFVVDLQVELILNLKISTLTQLYPNLINRPISLMEKERLWPLLRSMIWAPSKSINPSEVVALEDQRKSKFLKVQMHFITHEDAIKLVKDELKNFYLTTVELDLSDYPNMDDDKIKINENNYGKMEIDDDDNKLLPLTPISPTAPNRILAKDITTVSEPFIGSAKISYTLSIIGAASANTTFVPEFINYLAVLENILQWIDLSFYITLYDVKDDSLSRSETEALVMSY